MGCISSAALDDNVDEIHNSVNALRGSKNISEKVPVGVCKDMRVSYDFTGSEASKTLTVKKNELVLVLNNSDDTWFLVRNKEGNEGCVPASYLSENTDVTLSEGWFFEYVNRRDSSHILTQYGKPGGFMVRKALTKAGYSLSVFTDEGNVKHYIISNDGDKYFIHEAYKFKSVQKLVKAYQNCNLGICHQLTTYPSQVPPSLSSLAKDVWEVSRSSITMVEQLGTGQFGEVWMGIYNNSIKVAVKTLKPGTMTSQAFMAEANIMKKLRHPKLVQLLAVCTKGEPLYIITELMKNGSLLSFLQQKKLELGVPTLIDMGAQVAEGMAYLETNNFIHRDLAARNVLVGDGNCCKVADFGLSRITEDGEYSVSSDSKFPVKWTAPEAALSHLFSTKSDVWSYGILLYEIMTYGTLPYKGMKNTEALHKVLSGYRLPKPKIASNDLYEIMLECWSEDPQQRPTFYFLSERMSYFSGAADDSYR